MDDIEHEQGLKTRQARDKQRLRVSNSYKKDMNKFLTIIYHNINRLQEDKPTMRRSASEPNQLKLDVATEKKPFMEHSVSGTAYKLVSRTHSDSSQYAEYDCCSTKPLKGKVSFSKPLTQ